jgi:hypothetical protein
MGDAKRPIVKPISSKDACRIVRALHYSEKTTQNSQLHLGVFFDGKCGGAMQFGPSLDKRKSQRLVTGTLWNEFIELNRMAFADWLPKNSESRAIGVTMRLLKKKYPHIEWVISFADGTQCGDGTIYRASGFVLTDIRESDALRTNPKTGETVHIIQAHHLKISKEFRTWKPLQGYQFRYIYFLNPEARQRLTAPIIPFSEISARGVGMYLGKLKCGVSIVSNAPTIQVGEGGENPTTPLQPDADPS